MTVLHVDDHTDLMEPLIARRSQRSWTDLITGARVDLRDPSSVAAAVRSGAIGVAGFFTPFVHELARGEIRHLRAGDPATGDAPARLLGARNLTDDLLAPGAARPAVELGPPASDPDGWTYRATADPRTWLAGLHDAPVLLHVDFDYFANRFDGDSDWNLYAPVNDVGDTEVARRVDTIVAALDAADVARLVQSVSGALSPGFFPAELWASTVERLAGGLASLGIDVSAWR